MLQLCCPESACLHGGRLVGCLEEVERGLGPGTFHLGPINYCAHLLASVRFSGKRTQLAQNDPWWQGVQPWGPLGPQSGAAVLAFLLISRAL